MKRQELLKQLDETVDRLEKELAETKKQIRQFKEEENQRVPKWAKPPKTNWMHYLSPKWYQVKNGVVFDDIGDIRQVTSLKINWDLCYDDNPPEEKTTVRKLGPDDKIEANDFIIWDNCSIVSRGLDILNVPVHCLTGYPKTVAIRFEKE